MNTQQVQDMRLMYEAVYNENLREKAEEYNNTVYDEDIVEVATEYFYTYGLNEDGIDILIEKVGLDNFVEFVYDLSEDLILTEARKVSKAKKQPGTLRSRQQEKLAAQRASAERKETEEKEPESEGADTEAKREQPKSKKPVRDAIARNIFRAVDAYKAGMERHKAATETAGRLASETGNTLGKIASVTREAGRRAGEHVKKHGLKSLANEEFDNFDVILEYLISEGYADTNENALAIMANMSEAWVESIVERKHPIMSVTSPTGEKRSKKRPGATVDSDYHEHENPDQIKSRRFSQQLSDRKKKKESEMTAGRLTVATKRGIEKATNRSNDSRVGGNEFAPDSALRRREEDDQPTDYRARRRRASGR
jgi:hypothetical protein